jgi:hypothetical protein
MALKASCDMFGKTLLRQMLDYTYKSLDGQFPRKLTNYQQRKPSPFGKTWTETLDLLEKELRHLGYRRGSCVIQTAHTPYDVRNDGRLRRDARKPEHPGVVITFDKWNGETKRYDKMSFECDQFVDYAANIRAIADAMEALRKVDRYAVSGGGKSNAHYEGYKALNGANESDTAQAAAQFISDHSGIFIHPVDTNSEVLQTAYRRAAMKLHPDKGGSSEQFSLLKHYFDFLNK